MAELRMTEHDRKLKILCVEEGGMRVEVGRPTVGSESIWG